MSESSGESKRVHLEYRYRPYERILYSLRFGRQYRVLGPIGAVLFVVGTLQLIPDWTWLLVPSGAFLLLGFVWIPFNASLRSKRMTFDATSDGIELDVGGLRGQMSWGSVRGTRRAAGAFILEMEPAGTIAIPLRVLARRDLSTLEDLTATARGPNRPSERVVSAEGDATLMRVRHEIRLRDVALAMWLRPAAVAVLLAGAVILVAGIAALLARPNDTLASAAWPLMALGLAILAAPAWGTAFRVYQGGGARAMTAPYELEIGADGYRARLGDADSWTPWSSFESVRRVGRVYLFRPRGSRADVVISGRAFSQAQVERFSDILRHRGLEAA